MATSQKRKKVVKRRNLRYHDPNSNNVILFYHTLKSKKKYFNALIVNESFKGIACVIAENKPFKKNQEICWQEAKNIVTPCRVAYCRKIEQGVYFIGLNLITQNI
jgi:hypothetical protein